MLEAWNDNKILNCSYVTFSGFQVGNAPILLAGNYWVGYQDDSGNGYPAGNHIYK